MELADIQSVLGFLTGSFKPVQTSSTDVLKETQLRMGKILLQQKELELPILKSIPVKELFQPSENQLSQITKITDSLKNTSTEEVEELFFIRTAENLHPFIQGSQPNWARNSNPIQSMGPFIDGDGQFVIVDIYQTTKLVTLYVGNMAVFSFKARTRLSLNNALPREIDLAKGSLWINANLLNKTAPAELFAGFDIENGKLILNQAPSYANNKYSIPANFTFQLNFTLSSSPTQNYNPTYALDGKTVSVSFPKEIELKGSLPNTTFSSTGRGEVKAYNINQSFSVTPNVNLKYNAEDSIIYTSVRADVSSINVDSNSQKYIQLEGSAAIKETEWLFPLSTINFQQIPTAANNFFIRATVDKGIAASWKHLKYQSILLNEAQLYLQTGKALWRDKAAYGLAGATHLQLWRNSKSGVQSFIDIQYTSKQPFLFFSDAKDDIEQIFTTAKIISNFDRPITVRHTPFNFSSKNSMVLFQETKNGVLVGLSDSNILEDNSLMVTRLEAFALENALFKVSNIQSFTFSGKLLDESDQVHQLNSFLFYKLYQYQPTLPDPYLGNFAYWERVMKALQNKPLIYHIQMDKGGKENETLETKFYFGSLPTAEDLKFDESDQADDDIEIGRRPTLEVERTSQPTLKVPSLRKELKERILKDKEILNQTQPIKKSQIKNQLALFEANKIKPVISKDIKTVVDISNIWREAFTPKPVFTETNELNILNRDILNKRAEELTKHHRYEEVYENDVIGYRLENEFFRLLDVSSNANQLGVSLSGQQIFIPTNKIKDNANGEYDLVQAQNMSFIVEGMEVKFQNDRIRTFMLPQHSWEPVLNISDIPRVGIDPEVGFNFFANNGGPSRVINNSKKYTPLTPIAHIDAIVQDFKNDSSNYTLAAFTLPFGKRAVSVLYHKGHETIKPKIENLRPKFRKQKDGTPFFEGGHQLSLKAGNHGIYRKSPNIPEDSPMFPGFTLQFVNYLNKYGEHNNTSHLGDWVTDTFNLEFFRKFLQNPTLKESRGVPLTRVDLTGYGSNIISNWVSSAAQLNEVSQSKWDTFHGRTSHEVIQVKSLIYPWGIRVVRTITTYRGKEGIIYREDSGWQPESDGRFNFKVKGDLNDKYEFHPGLVKGIINIQNIRDSTDIKLYEAGRVTLNPVYFDGDIILESVTKGGTNNIVPSKKILGYLHKYPQGELITPNELALLFQAQPLKSIGGMIDCEINLHESQQMLRAHRFDISVCESGAAEPSFIGAIRGNVILPNDGSWTVVEHDADTGEVYPVNQDKGVSFVRVGKWDSDKFTYDVDPNNQLVKMSPPEQLLLNYTQFKKNFGLLQNTNTQKTLFLAPSFAKNRKAILTRIEPLFADAYKLMNGAGIFPNIGNAVNNFGTTVILSKGRNANNQLIDAFKELNFEDAGKKVFETIQIELVKQGEKVVEKGIRLAKNIVNETLDKAFKFDIPQGDIFLIDEKMFKLYVEYLPPANAPVNYDSYYGQTMLDYDFDSLKNDFVDQWKSRLSNIALVVDLGPIKKLVTVKANFNSQKGEETKFGGSANGVGVPRPDVIFSPELKPIMDVLNVLQKLSGGEYDDVIKSGLKIAMSNSGEVWSYKYEIDKSIPLIRFPAQDELYNSATTPLKLECGLELGAYFNAALKVTNDAKQLIPTAGAYLGFSGGLEVLCTSIGAGSIFAIGKVGLKLSADSSGLVQLNMDFGFGVKIVVSLPVVGHASVSFMVGVKLEVKSNGDVLLLAVMQFKGNASIAGGLVSVTIMIEAKGGVKKSGNKTDCSAQVTFALDISIFMVIDISFSKTWGEDRQIA